MLSIDSRARKWGPGLILAFTIAAAAQFLSEHYGAPVMLFALLIGMAFHFLSTDEKCAPGLAVASKPLLKIGIVLLGARVTIGDIMSLGPVPVLMVPGLLVLTVGSGILLARIFGRSVWFGLLTGGAVAICGASAALALSAILPKSAEGERDTLFTVVAVTALSTVAMIAYPIIFTALGFTDSEIGVLLGATIHDVAQVVGAGYGVSNEAGDIATFVKLLRVACLPLVVIALALILRLRQGEAAERIAFPWFALGFAVVLLINSAGLIPEWMRTGMDWVSRALLVAAIAALGVKTSLGQIAALGPKHLLVVVLETFLLLCFALAVVSALM